MNGQQNIKIYQVVQLPVFIYLFFIYLFISPTYASQHLRMRHPQPHLTTVVNISLSISTP